MKRVPFLALVLLGFILGLSCQKRADSKKVDFVTQIKPVLEARCINCHNSGALFGELNLENRELAHKPRAKGPVIIPGEASKSPFFMVLTLPEGDRKAMPPTGHRIPSNEAELIRLWISQGAVWPDGAEGVLKPKVREPSSGVSS
jgi:Planctomycete cytochrome C